MERSIYTPLIRAFIARPSIYADLATQPRRSAILSGRPVGRQSTVLTATSAAVRLIDTSIPQSQPARRGAGLLTLFPGVMVRRLASACACTRRTQAGQLQRNIGSKYRRLSSAASHRDVYSTVPRGCSCTRDLCGGVMITSCLGQRKGCPRRGPSFLPDRSPPASRPQCVSWILPYDSDFGDRLLPPDGRLSHPLLYHKARGSPRAQRR